MGGVPGPCPVLVEREPELRALSAAAGDAASRGARLVLVTGEAGAGKTRLWNEFLDTLPEGWRTEFVGGHRLDQSWAAPFEALVGPVADSGDPARALGDSVADECTARAGDGPLALVIEDLHFLDPVSVAALPYALERMRTASVLVVATYRIGSHPVGSPHSRAVADLVRAANAFELRLSPLTAAGVQQMAEALGAEVDATALQARTQGNPFFVEELVRGTGDEVPWTVAEAVVSRLESLPPAAIRLAETLALVGGPLPGPVLDRVDAAWTESFRVLADAALAVPEGDGAVLRHALVAEALAGRLGMSERRDLHRDIAAAVDAATPDRVELLARHWAGAGEPAKAAEPAAAAADRASARGGHRTATELYRIALEHPPEDAVAACALLERAATSAASADETELAKIWAAAARLAGENAGPRWKAIGAWGNPIYQRIVQQSRASDPTQAEGVSAQVVAAQDLVRRGDYPGAIHTARRAMSTATAIGDLALEANAALVLYYAGDLAGAAAELERIGEEARRAGDPMTETSALSRRARVLFASGDLRGAAELGDQLVAVARNIGDVVVWGSMQVGVALVAGCCGDIATADALSAELIAADDPMVVLMGRAAAVLPALESVDQRDARAHLDAVIPAVRTLEIDYFTLPMLINEARWHQQQADDATALDRLAEVEHLLFSPVQEHLVDFWTIRARSARRMGRRDLVEAAAARLTELAHHATAPSVASSVEEATAALAALDGRVDEALARYERAANGWESAPRWVLACEAWFDTADLARTTAPARAAGFVERALAVARDHGLARCRRRAETLRAELVTAPAADPRLALLTPRELEIARMVAEGRTNREVGDALYLSEKTVRNALSGVFAKLAVARRGELAALLARGA